jgi:hypothetical protein
MATLRIIRPCEEDWDSMRETGEGRFCARCGREVLELTETRARDAKALLRGGECVRMRKPAAGACPDIQSPFASWALVAGTAAAAFLMGCADAYAIGRERAHYASLAGCPGAPEPSTPRESDPDDLSTSDICTIVPDGPQCRQVAEDRPRALGDSVIEPGPMHLRPSCSDLWRRDSPILMGQVAIESEDVVRRRLLSRPSDYPEGIDVVVAGIAADGVDPVTVRRMARGMLEPLERCYRPHVDEATRTAPQGRLFVTARVADDGSLLDPQVESSPGLPDDLAACASSYLRTAHVAAPDEDLASVELDVRLVYRTLPR